MKLLFLLFVFSYCCLASLKFGSYNIRTFDKHSSSTNKLELRKILENADFDFFAVEEIVNADSFEKFIEEYFHQYTVTLSKCGGAGHQKLGFVYDHFKFKLLNIKEDDSLSNVKNRCDSLRPAMIGEFLVKSTGETFTAVAVHLKAGSGHSNYSRRNVQYGILSSMVKKYVRSGQKNVVLMGDFNTTGYIHKDEDYKNFRKFINGNNLSTSARYIRCTSYWSGTDYGDHIEESSILDHIIYSDNFLNHKSMNYDVYAHCKKASCKNTYESDLGISYEEVSDHCPIALTVND